MTTPAPEFAELQGIARAYQQSRALTVAAELGIADLLRDGARHVDDLAAATSTHAPTLYRLLRALASVGVFDEDDARRFSLTSMGEYLRSDHPTSLAHIARMYGADYQWQAWGALMQSVRTGENAAKLALGESVWDYRRDHPEHGQVFDAAMRTQSRSSAPAEIAAHDFGRYNTIVDVGGGTGAMLVALLAAHAKARGILFDQPHVVSAAGAVLEGAGVADRASIEPGSFFKSVPAGGDAYVLRRILHDWPDEECTEILRRCHEAMTPEARLIVIDCVVGPPNEDAPSKFLDLMMLVSAGGRERTEPEWKALFAGGGFALLSVTRATVNSHVLEAAPA
jgi:hypothetical protein